MTQLLELGPVFAGPQGVAAVLAAMTRRAAALKVVAVAPALLALQQQTLPTLQHRLLTSQPTLLPLGLVVPARLKASSSLLVATVLLSLATTSLLTSTTMATSLPVLTR